MAGTVKQIIISVTSLICGSVAVDYVKPVVANFLSPQSSPPSAPPPALEPPPARPQPMPRPTWSVPIAVLEPTAPVVPPSEPAVAPSEPTLKFVTPTPPSQSRPRRAPRPVWSLPHPRHPSETGRNPTGTLPLMTRSAGTDTGKIGAHPGIGNLSAKESVVARDVATDTIPSGHPRPAGNGQFVARLIHRPWSKPTLLTAGQ